MVITELSFSKLLSGYPHRRNGRVEGGCEPFTNQCAIRLSRALAAAGTPVDGYGGTNTCVAEQILHIRGAKSLADHIWKTYGRPEQWTNPERARAAMRGRTGIVFFRRSTVNHIDLWDTTGAVDNDLTDSSFEIWFWEVRG